MEVLTLMGKKLRGDTGRILCKLDEDEFITVLGEVFSRKNEESWLHNTGVNEGGYTWISKKDCDRLAKIYGDTYVPFFRRTKGTLANLSFNFVQYKLHETHDDGRIDTWNATVVEINGVEGYRDHWSNTHGVNFNDLIAPYFKWIPDSVSTTNARKAKAKEITL